MSHSNLALLTETARLLKPLLDEIVFVAGCTTALLIDFGTLSQDICCPTRQARRESHYSSNGCE
jgi:hypothetical protein